MKVFTTKCSYFYSTLHILYPVFLFTIPGTAVRPIHEATVLIVTLWRLFLRVIVASRVLHCPCCIVFKGALHFYPLSQSCVHYILQLTQTGEMHTQCPDRKISDAYVSITSCTFHSIGNYMGDVLIKLLIEY